MKSTHCRVSFCSRCRFYDSEGRRGGVCGQLGVPVKGGWAACSLALPVFSDLPVDLQPRGFLPQPIELDFAEVMLDAALLEAVLDVPSVYGYQAADAKPALART